MKGFACLCLEVPVFVAKSSNAPAIKEGYKTESWRPDAKRR